MAPNTNKLPASPEARPRHLKLARDTGIANTPAKTGLLLINLGTPDSPSVSDVRRYLREFLMDGCVLDMPTWRRYLLVHLVILPSRPKISAENYRKIWTPRGSPLLFHGQDLRDGIQAHLGSALPVALAMRYGNPSIRAAIDEFVAIGVNRIVLLPLFAQTSGAASVSAIEAVRDELAKMPTPWKLNVVPSFYNHSAYIETKAQLAAPVVEEVDPDLVLFSFHGLPNRQLASAAPGLPCLTNDFCCSAESAKRGCYRAQCQESAQAIAEHIGLSLDIVRISFQSRLGSMEWMSPFTDEVLAQEARRGGQRVVVISGFVADCLETLEELEIRGREIWRENGGERFEVVSCPNSHEAWVRAVIEIAREHL